MYHMSDGTTMLFETTDELTYESNHRLAFTDGDPTPPPYEHSGDTADTTEGETRILFEGAEKVSDRSPLYIEPK